MKVNDIKSPVSALPGVGPQIAKQLSKLNIFTVGNLLQYYPRDYEDRSIKIPLKDYKICSKIHTVAQITAQEWFGYGRMKTLKLIINDGTASAELVCFNRAFLEKSLTPGTIISLSGSFYIKYGKVQSSSFEAVKITDPYKTFANQIPYNLPITPMVLTKLIPPDSGILPVYPLTEGLTQKKLSKIIESALSQYAKGIDNEIPEELIEEHKLLSKQEAIIKIHNPQNMQQAMQARHTLSYEELFHLNYAIAQRSYKHRGSIPSTEITKKDTFESDEDILESEFRDSLSPLQKKLLDKLPFPLTKDQRKVISQMNKEIDRGYEERNKTLLALDSGNLNQKNYKPVFTLSRLLQGDVGSGKTLTAIFICLRVISYKGQCAFMAPTELLARQHAETISKMLDSLGIKTAFLTGNIKASGRAHLLSALKNGEIDIAVGTHALFSSQVIYKDLQLAVIDEQHRFGVLQRQAILEKGRKTEENGIIFEPHLLMMSATPIPQTLALTLFGDLDVSTIKTMPAGRKPIQTYLVKEGNEFNAYEAVRKELEKGHQAYFVYPAIESTYDFSDSADDEGASSSGIKLKSAEKSFELLSKKVYPQYKAALVHSKIDEEEQNTILKDFHSGKIQILAATTVIEVGVDVPNATCMVIEQADHFGMAQLHQLRGRVGRGSEQSYCFMIYSKNITENGIERMKALRQSTDGFYLAEQDLKTRGPGELNGTAQAGALELGIADVVRDKDLLIQSRADAFRYFSKNIKSQN
ncbi:MAG: ATP-dependent DNA helicase RecG [Treponema sp.]|nr:ATP-dependent DNA helicase RecG [Treponema sp.]